jgi:hypothetical protein
MSESHIEHHTKPGPGHETSDISPFTMGIWIVGLFVTVIITALFVKAYFHYTPLLRYDMAGKTGADNQYRTPEAIDQIPEPRLQPVPGQELRDIRAQEDAILEGYGWVDQAAGVVRIPVERAMEILAQKGLPARSENEANRGK